MTKPTITVSLEQDLIDSLDMRAESENRSRSSMVSHLLGSALKENEGITMRNKNGSVSYLKVLRNCEAGLVDMMYVDPPFVTNEDYINLWNDDTEFNTESSLKSYIEWIKPMLVQCRRILKSTGSIIVHCDQGSHHYLKIELDRIFGMENFRNEIACLYSDTEGAKPGVILWYSKGKNYKFNGNDSQTDVWLNMKLDDAAPEKCIGYSGYLPEIIMERLVLTFSDEDDIIFDPTHNNEILMSTAHRLKRNTGWIETNHITSTINMDVVSSTMTTEILRNMDPCDFEKWVCKVMSAKTTLSMGDMGVDGIVETPSSSPKYHGAVIQVKRSDSVGSPVVDHFIGTMKKLNRNIGFLIGFSFTATAKERIEEHNETESSKIYLISVENIVGKTFNEITAALE